MKPKVVITLLVVLFVGPIVLSWLMVRSDVDWTQRGLSNHGVLLRPPIDLREVTQAALLFDALDLAPSEWALINLAAEPCDAACVQRHERLRVIHSVMGSARDRLEVMTVAGGPGPAANDEIVLAPDTVAALAERLVNHADGAALPQIVVLDWRRQLMMRFPADAPSGDIQKDLKKLLRASKIR